MRLANKQGLSLTGPGELLKQFTKNVLETALSEKKTQHLGHEKNRVAEGRAPASPVAITLDQRKPPEDPGGQGCTT